VQKLWKLVWPRINANEHESEIILAFLHVFMANPFCPQFIVAKGIPRKLGITEKAYCLIRGLASE
jgi:hypothetical protein